MGKALDVGESDGREFPRWIDGTGVAEKSALNALTERDGRFHDREEVRYEPLLPLGCDQRW